MPLVEMERVSRDYGLGKADIAALRDVDLVIKRAEFVAVWGPSGSGKSTLCNLAGGIDKPTSGRILIDGRDVSTLSDDQLSEHRNRSVGFVFQHFNLVEVLDALENVMLPLILRGETAGSARRKALSLMEELGLAHLTQQRPDRLSGGERQRVAVARALVTGPVIVIADEPTANLDTENAQRIVDMMQDLNASKGVTFLFATHDERLLKRVRRRIHLRDGVVVEDTAGSQGPSPAGAVS